VKPARPSHWKTNCAEALLVAFAYLCLSWFTPEVARWSNGLAALWPCNAVLVAYFLVRPRRDWPLPAALVVLVCLGVSAVSGRPAVIALGFATANLVESLSAALLLQAVLRARPDLERPRDLFVFVASSIVAVGLSASIAAPALMTLGEPFGHSWLSWFSADALGLLIVVPLILIARKALRSGQKPTRRQIVDAALSFGLVLAVSAFVFLQDSRPIAFLISPAVLVATFRLRGIGAAFAIVIVIAVGVAGGALHTGPLTSVHGTASAKITLIQLFLVTTFLTSLPIAAVLAERDRFGRKLQESEAQFRAVVDVVTDVIFRTDVQGRWTFLNPAWEQLTGYTIDQSLGTSFLSPVVAADRADFLKRLEGLKLGLFESVECQFRFYTAAGEERWAEARVHRLEGMDGQLIGSAGILTDISDRIALAAHLDEARQRAERDAEAALLLASTDELTGVASRRAFLAYFEEQLAEARKAGTPLSLAVFDIDHFKRVNDRHGHAAGDDVLKRIAAIASGCSRERDLVGRLGGEEFAILMPHASIAQAGTVAERLRNACATAEGEIPVTVSVGVAAASAASTAASLLKDADVALYRAKAEGRNCLRLAA
jgi:diguanylate cyclase (GGDEF)-like protein/PAS domain S-box-containing protein